MEGHRGRGNRGQTAGEQEQVVKVAEYVERAEDLLGHSYVVLETDQGNTIITEKLRSGAVTWEVNPAGLEARNSLAKVIRYDDCGDASIAVWQLKNYQPKATHAVSGASASKCKRYARCVYDRATALLSLKQEQ